MTTKRKLPKSLKILGMPVAIECVPDSDFEEEEICAYVDEYARKIFVCDQLIKSHRDKLVHVLIHEFIHHVERAHSLPDSPEWKIDLFASAIHSLIVDNPDFIKLALTKE